MKNKRWLFSLILVAIIILPIKMLCIAQNKGAVQYKVKIVETLPHNTRAYTQGLFFHKGRLFESSGQYGTSFFHEVDLIKGNTLRSINIEKQFFAEGAVVFKEKLYILTWMENTVLVYDINTFKQVGKLYNRREGWGLTTDGISLISSDGSSNLYFHDPATFADRSVLKVTLNGKPIDQINELEYIEGEIWANIYGSDTIIIINPSTGIVRATIDCSGILPPKLRKPETDVLNGIAYNPVDKKIYITGKLWPRLFRIELGSPL